MTRKPHKTRETKVTSEFEHGWNDMLKGIKKLKKILDGLPEPQFSPEDHINLYTYPSSNLLFSIFLSIPLFVTEALFVCIVLIRVQF